ncbi:phosphoglycerate mutase, partial [Acinetobacter baumannii]
VVHLPSFYDRYQKVGAVVSGIDLVAGMGLALGMKSIKPSLATGYENTDLVQKLEVALSLIQEVDVLIVHI